MFFILSKILIFLLKPFSYILLSVLAALLVRGARWKGRLAAIALALIWLFGNGFLFNTVLLSWEMPAADIAALPDSAAYAVVLGGTADVERAPYDRLYFNKGAERITQAVGLYKAGKVKKILYTGGRSELFTDPEADNRPIVGFYRTCGVPEEDVLIESRSRNTVENARFSRALIEDEGGRGTLILLTSAFHMRRALACYRREGLDVVAFPTDYNSVLPDDRWKFAQFMPSARTLHDWEFLIKEIVGYYVYRWSGYA